MIELTKDEAREALAALTAHKYALATAKDAALAAGDHDEFLDVERRQALAERAFGLISRGREPDDPWDHAPPTNEVDERDAALYLLVHSKTNRVVLVPMDTPPAAVMPGESTEAPQINADKVREALADGVYRIESMYAIDGQWLDTLILDDIWEYQHAFGHGAYQYDMEALSLIKECIGSYGGEEVALCTIAPDAL